MAESYTPTGATAAAIERFTAAEAATGTYGTMIRTFHTEIADRTRFLLATGLIAFPATQVTSADANTLDDYEEGSWTPGISFGGGTTDITYTTQTGSYTKIGNRVTVACHIILSNKGSSTGAALITGLPFTVASTHFTSGGLRVKNISFADYPQAFANSNATTVALEESTNAGTVTDLADTDFANNSEIMFSATFRV